MFGKSEVCNWFLRVTGNYIQRQKGGQLPFVAGFPPSNLHQKDSKGYFHGISMVFPWYFHGISMVFPTDFPRIFPWPLTGHHFAGGGGAGRLARVDRQRVGTQLVARWALGVWKIGESMTIWLVVWNIFYFPIYWESSSHLTNIFQRGSNHQPDMIFIGIGFS